MVFLRPSRQTGIRAEGPFNHLCSLLSLVGGLTQGLAGLWQFLFATGSLFMFPTVLLVLSAQWPLYTPIVAREALLLMVGL